MTLSRRGFLRGASGALGLFGATVAMNKVLGGDAFAATLSGYSGYRALVTVFLLGGNDGNNLLVPLTSNGSTGPYDRYLSARPNVGLKTASNELLPVSPIGQAAGSYGIHYRMPKLKALFDDLKAAFVLDVGPLVEPLRKADYAGTVAQKPENLFSHSDQQDAWASAIANPGTAALPPELVGLGPTGWGGRAADRIAPIQTGTYPEVVILGGKALFGSGGATSALTMGGSGQFGLTATSDAAFNQVRDEALDEILTFTNGQALEEVYGQTTSSAIAHSEQRKAARDAAWSLLEVATRNEINEAFGATTTDGAALPMTDGSLLGQVYQVIRDIIAGATPAASGGLGLRRQMFSVGLGGFDTHVGQRAAQDGLLAQLDDAIGAFQGAMDALAASSAFGAAPPQATLFTMSDFGRTLVENSDGGTDHAWGSHVIVVGSRVMGQKLIGAFPNLDLSNGGAQNEDTTDSRGRWIPQICVEQLANTFAYWLGATSSADRAYMFPNLAGFVAAATAGAFPAHTKSYRFTGSLMMAD